VSDRTTTDTSGQFRGTFNGTGYSQTAYYFQSTQTNAFFDSGSNIHVGTVFLNVTSQTDYYHRIYAYWTSGENVKVFPWMSAIRIQ